MTQHNEPYNDDLDVSHLEPGCDDNPLEWQERYNPLKYCYLVPCEIDEIRYELAVRFLLQQHKDQDPIHFIDPKTGKAHEIALFPRVPGDGIGLEPIVTPEPDLTNGYQLGEQKYYLVPSVVRVRRFDGEGPGGDVEGFQAGNPNARVISREAARHLISPDVLVTALRDFQDRVAQDENAPAGLLDLLGHWDESNDWKSVAFDDDDLDDYEDNYEDYEDYEGEDDYDDDYEDTDDDFED